MANKKHKPIKISVKFDIGWPCKRCGKRFIVGYIGHVCIRRIGQRNARG